MSFVEFEFMGSGLMNNVVVHVMLCSWELIKEVQITCAANASLSVVTVIYGKNINS